MSGSSEPDAPGLSARGSTRARRMAAPRAAGPACIALGCDYGQPVAVSRSPTGTSRWGRQVRTAAGVAGPLSLPADPASPGCSGDAGGPENTTTHIIRAPSAGLLTPAETVVGSRQAPGNGLHAPHDAVTDGSTPDPPSVSTDGQRRGRVAPGAVTGPRPPRTLQRSGGVRVHQGPFRVTRKMLSKAWNDRVLGLAAEAGFWQLLSLPPLLLAVLGTIGYLGKLVGADATARVQSGLISAAGHLLAPSAVDQIVRPTLDEVLRRGRLDVISVGFVASLWSGSTAMATYVNTITIAYGERDARSAVRSRLLALRLYLAQVVTGIVLLPALVLGPGYIEQFLHGRVSVVVHEVLTLFYWPTVGLLSLGILASLYHLAVPCRRRWRQALPGAVLALFVWLVGSYGLRYYIKLVFGQASTYGTLAAPLAILLFFYITALAVLLGAELNAALDVHVGAPAPRSRARWPRRRRARHVL